MLVCLEGLRGIYRNIAFRINFQPQSPVVVGDNRDSMHQRPVLRQIGVYIKYVIINSSSSYNNTRSTCWHNVIAYGVH